MTSTALTSLPHTGTRLQEMQRRSWLWLGVLGGLFIALHWSFIERTLRVATDATGETRWLMIKDAIATPWSKDWSHLLVVPLISLYYIFQHRDRLAAAPKRVFWPGLLLLFAGIFSFGWWIYPGRNDLFQGLSIIISLLGLTLFLVGPAATKQLLFPILYLLLAIRIPGRVWEQIAFVLQMVAAKTATMCLQVLSAVIPSFIDVQNTGSQIVLVFQQNGQTITEPMNIAEACSGLRMLMAFVALGVAMAFLFERAWWQRLVIILLTVPIAVGVNVGRVTVLGLMFLVNKDMTQGDFHTMIGLFMLLPAGLLFMLVGWVMDRIFITDEQAPPSTTPGDSKPAPLELQSSGRDGSSMSRTAAIKGLPAGLMLGLLVGLSYMMALALQAPAVRESMGQWIGQGMIGFAMIVLLILLAVASVFVVKMVRSRQATAMGVGVGVLLIATLGLDSVVAATRVVLNKKSVPLRVELDRLDRKLGPWTMVKDTPALSAEIIEALGTKQSISRWYVDSRVHQPVPVNIDRGIFAKGSVVLLHVPYYTGTPDTVPHVPERCLTAAGMRRAGQDIVTLDLLPGHFRAGQDGWFYPLSSRFGPNVRLADINIPVTRFAFYPPRYPERKSHVIYFFSANGKYLPTPDHVRLQGFGLTDVYSYYCKIELTLPGVSESEEAEKIAGDFLSVALPEIMACLPDWHEVKNGRWPKP